MFSRKPEQQQLLGRQGSASKSPLDAGPFRIPRIPHGRHWPPLGVIGIGTGARICPASSSTQARSSSNIARLALDHPPFA
jgi:hypothetical protein